MNERIDTTTDASYIFLGEDIELFYLSGLAFLILI